METGRKTVPAEPARVLAGEKGLRSEIEALLDENPSLSSLLHQQPDEPDVMPFELLCSGPSPFYIVEVPIPGRKGRVWASRLPGVRPVYTTEEVSALVRFGIQRIVCLVPTQVLENLHGAYRYLPIAESLFPQRFHQIEIPDHDIPPNDGDFEKGVALIDEAVTSGESVLVHCVGGCGRTGLFVACLMVRAGLGPVDAIRAFRRRRRCGPETLEQIAYVVRYARRFGTEPRASFRPDSVRFSVDENGSPRLLARGGLGAVFVGRLRWQGGGSRRVAIKRFLSPLDRPEAEEQTRRIEAVRAAGVRIPRMLMCRLEDGGWVQVTPLFGSIRRGSKLRQPSQFYRELDLEQKRFAIDQLTRVANAGYSPSVDLFVVFQAPRTGIVPLDLDLLAPEDPITIGRKLVRCVVQIGSSRPERDDLLAVAYGTATASTRESMSAALSGERNPFRSLWDLE